MDLYFWLVLLVVQVDALGLWDLPPLRDPSLNFWQCHKVNICSQPEGDRVSHSTMLTFAPGRSNSLKQKEVETSGISWSVVCYVQQQGSLEFTSSPSVKGASIHRSRFDIGLDKGRHSMLDLKHCMKNRRIIAQTVMLFLRNSEIRTSIKRKKEKKEIKTPL